MSNEYEAERHAADPLLANLQQKIRVIMNDWADHVAGGACRDYAEYKHVAGIIEGLALAEREILLMDQQITEA